MRLPWQKKWHPVSVLTGFLGSGKTTILQQLLTRPEMKGTALIINEFGEVSVDHLLVENAEEKMVLLANGCVCCSVRGDLVQAIKSLFERQRSDDIPPFDRILLETTGLADPGPIVQSLIGPALTRYPVFFDSIATTVDTTNVLEAMQHNAQMLPQIAVADSLLLTKSDLSEEEGVVAVEDEMRRLNPRATMVRSNKGDAPSDLVFGQRLLDPGASPRQMRSATDQMFSSYEEGGNTQTGSAASGHEDICSFVITRDEALSYATLDTFLQALRSYRGEDLLRVKGLVKLRGSEGRPSVVHGVQSVMHPPTTLRRWPTKDHRTQLVFITRKISHSDVENMLSGIERGFR
jgi:G3E family GTPase